MTIVNLIKSRVQAAGLGEEETARSGADTTEKTAREGLAGEVVKTTGNQTVAGVKTFSSAPVVPDAGAANNPASLKQLTTEEERAKAGEKGAEEGAKSASIPIGQKGANSGVASLDSSGKVPSAQIPAQPNNETYFAASESAQLALNTTAHKGDRLIRTDTHKEYVRNGESKGTLGDWTEIPHEGEVISVNSKNGAVTLTAADVGAATTAEAAAKLAKAANLSDLTNTAEARTALGLSSAATQPTSAFEPSGAVSAEATTRASADEARLLKTENLKDLANTGTARANLKVPNLSACACVVTTNVVSLEGLQTFDGYTLEAEDIALLVGQTEQKNNGPWIVPASGPWERPKDFATGVECKARTVVVAKGTNYEGTQWYLNTTKTITVGTSNQSWTRLSKFKATTPGAWVDPPTFNTVVETLDGPEITVKTPNKKFLVRVAYKTHKAEVKFSIQTGAKGILTGYKELVAKTEIQHAETTVELLSEEELQLVKEELKGTVPQGLSVKFQIETVG